MKHLHRFQIFRQFSNLFSQIWLKKRHTSLFSGICREIRTKFHQNSQNKIQNSTQKMKKNRKLKIHLLIREKMLTIFGWNFEIWAVQKYVNLIHLHYFIFNFGSFLPKTHKCKSCKSRQELSNEYLLAKIGVDTAENEPLKVWSEIQFIIHSPP